MLAPQFEHALKERRTKQSILGQVKWILKRLLAGSRPDLLMIAKELGVSERTLQRRITVEGTTFRQILNETRQEMVRQYLGDTSVEITETAFLVGYDDPNSFYRAFRSWEGKTPAEWRAANQPRTSKRGEARQKSDIIAISAVMSLWSNSWLAADCSDSHPAVLPLQCGAFGKNFVVHC